MLWVREERIWVRTETTDMGRAGRKLAWEMAGRTEGLSVLPGCGE